MFSALKAMALAVCCTGWVFAGSAKAEQPVTSTVTTDSTLQTVNTVLVDDDDQSQGDGKHHRDKGSDARPGRDGGDGHGKNLSKKSENAKDGRDGGKGKSDQLARRGHGQKNDQRGGQGRQEFGFRDRGGRGDLDYARNGRGGRPFMRGGYDFLRGGSDFMRGGRDERNGPRDGHGQFGMMRNGHGRHGQQDNARNGRGRQYAAQGGRGYIHGGGPWQAQGRGGRPELANVQPKGVTLGVAVTNPDAELRSQLDLPEGAGLVVEQVLPNTLASKAGLKQYDVLQKIDDQIVINTDQVGVLIRMHKPGQRMQLSVIRQGKVKVIDATIGGAKPKARKENNFPPGRRPGNGQQRGFGHHNGQWNQNSKPEPGPTPDTSGAPAPPPPPAQDSHHKHQDDQGANNAPASHPSASISGLLGQFEDLLVD
jgi:hypothetical protein